MNFEKRARVERRLLRRTSIRPVQSSHPPARLGSGWRPWRRRCCWRCRRTAPRRRAAPRPPRPPGSAKPNRHPLWNQPPRPVTTVPNGARLEAGDPALAPPITVVHVSGSAFEMGEAHGRLMKRELLEYLPLVIEYLNVSLADVRRPHSLPLLCCCP
eukprot:COSAG04_NODE_11443_length_708_cov_17.676580_1_plen_156_part_10